MEELRYRWEMCLLNQCPSLSIGSELKDDFGSVCTSSHTNTTKSPESRLRLAAGNRDNRVVAGSTEVAEAVAVTTCMPRFVWLLNPPATVAQVATDQLICSSSRATHLAAA